MGGLLPLLWAASCSMLFGGATYAVEEAKKAELRRHNEQMNSEASYGSRSRSDCDNDY